MANREELRLKIKITGPNVDRDEIIVGRQGLRVGRSADNNLVLNHREISRMHMRITWIESDTYLVEDLNSSNGIWLNDVRLIARVPAELKVGDIVRAGPFQLNVIEAVYVSVAVAPAPQAEPSSSDSLELQHYNGGNGNGNGNGNGVVRWRGISHEQSNWLQYLPSIYSDDIFIGRYLLIFESVFNPLVWMIDNFDLYLTPEVAPSEWLQWMASWFDMLLLPELPIERQRVIMQQLGWLFLRRGTPMGLKRLLELYFGVTPEIIESEICHFVVRLPLGRNNTGLNAEIATRLIQSQKPAFASFTLEIL